MTESINYNAYMRRAMRHMISEILSNVADKGIPGDHHFYISFLTQAPGVNIPDHLLLQYPEEMTVILQDWFEDLAVIGDDRFAVTLSFHGKAEHLVIPFQALTGFSDPSVQFSMRFDAQDMDEEDFPSDENEHFNDEEGEITEKSDEPTQSGDADVIQLDSFRKK